MTEGRVICVALWPRFVWPSQQGLCTAMHSPCHGSILPQGSGFQAASKWSSLPCCWNRKLLNSHTAL